jgi:hypothetical protein
MEISFIIFRCYNILLSPFNGGIIIVWSNPHKMDVPY